MANVVRNRYGDPSSVLGEGILIFNLFWGKGMNPIILCLKDWACVTSCSCGAVGRYIHKNLWLTYIQVTLKAWGSVVAYVWTAISSELQLCNYVPFRTNTLGKCVNKRNPNPIPLLLRVYLEQTVDYRLIQSIDVHLISERFFLYYHFSLVIFYHSFS